MPGGAGLRLLPAGGGSRCPEEAQPRRGGARTRPRRFPPAQRQLSPSRAPLLALSSAKAFAEHPARSQPSTWPRSAPAQPTVPPVRPKPGPPAPARDRNVYIQLASHSELSSCFPRTCCLQPSMEPSAPAAPSPAALRSQHYPAHPTSPDRKIKSFPPHTAPSQPSNIYSRFLKIKLKKKSVLKLKLS